MTNEFEPANEDMEAIAREAVFLVAFTDEEGPLTMEACGELDDPEYRAAVVLGLRGLADAIEERGFHVNH